MHKGEHWTENKRGAATWLHWVVLPESVPPRYRRTTSRLQLYQHNRIVNKGRRRSFRCQCAASKCSVLIFYSDFRKSRISTVWRWDCYRTDGSTRQISSRGTRDTRTRTRRSRSQFSRGALLFHQHSRPSRVSTVIGFDLFWLSRLPLRNWNRNPESTDTELVNV